MLHILWERKDRFEYDHKHFIWASTAIRHISEKRSSQFQTLEGLIENLGVVNKSLSGLYATVLKDSLEWNDESKGQFSKIFSFILFSKRPLNIEEINNFLELESGTTHDKISSSKSCHIWDNHTRIHHAFLYDYLISSESIEIAWHIDEEKQKNNIAL